MNVILVSSVTLTGDVEARASGIGIYVKELSRELVNNKITVTLVTGTATPGSKDISGTAKDVRVIPVSRRTVVSNLGFMFKLMFKLPFMKFEDGSVIHAQRPELLLPFTLFRRKLPRVCTLHGSAYKSVSMKHGSLYTGIYRRIEGFCLKRAAKIISVDKYTRNEYKERYAYLPDTIEVVPTGLDLKKFKLTSVAKLRAKYKLPEKAPVVIYVGRLEREKRLDLLLRAFAELTKSYGKAENGPELVIAGDGRFRTELESLASDLGLKNARFLGAVPHDTVPDLLNSADVFALVSAFEGSPTVVKEALACGVPVVATEVAMLPS
jgi:glycosyltransferase involved in cell wall biosynthesis